MKSIKIFSLMMFVAGLICFIIAPLSAMKPTSQKFTIKTISIPQQVQPERYRSEEVWVKTSDDVIVGIPQWQIDQMKVLQVLFLQQKLKNSKDNPVEASMISYENLVLMQKVLNIASNLEEFALFCESLTSEQKGNLTNAAFTLEATGLAALLANVTFSPEIQEKLGSSTVTAESILGPVVKYLQDLENSKTVFGGTDIHVASFSPSGDYIALGGLVLPEHQGFFALWDGKTNKVKTNTRKKGSAVVSCLAFQLSTFRFQPSRPTVAHSPRVTSLA